MTARAPDTEAVPAGTVTRPTADEGRSLLAVDGLRMSFGGVHAVADASFTVWGGTITGLIGPNGAGKSTVMNLIGGQLRPSAGRILLDGLDVGGMEPYRLASRGVTRTFQTPSLFPRMTVMENLLLGAPPGRGESLGGALLGRRYWRRSESDALERARELLARFRAEGYRDEYADSLSGGQKRIVELMRALMARPRLLLLDEPMSGVNPALADSIANMLAALPAQGMTILMVEHELGMVERLCAPVIVMVQGRVLAEGSMEELRTNREVVDAYLAG